MFVRDFDTGTGFAYMYINNKCSKTLEETFRFNGSKGLYFMYPFKGPEVKYRVKPYAEALCLYKLDKRILLLESKVVISFT